MLRRSVPAPYFACLLANCSNGVDPRYGVSASPRVVDNGEAVPKGGGVYRVGNPYTVAGRTYIPEYDPHYQATGLASWYGEDFHGRRTANGEVFDLNSISAAHPTMPLPSYARVTNLSNGRSLIVRVNDRGPYHGDRIIDVSRNAAHLLGFHASGTAWVRVEYVGRAPLEGSDDRILAATLRQDEPAPPPSSVKLAATSIVPAAVSTSSIGRNTHLRQCLGERRRDRRTQSLSYTEGPAAETAPTNSSTGADSTKNHQRYLVSPRGPPAAIACGGRVIMGQPWTAPFGGSSRSGHRLDCGHMVGLCRRRRIADRDFAAGHAASNMSVRKDETFQTNLPAALLLDPESDSVLFEKNGDQLVAPASLAKLMTLEYVFNEIKQGRIKLDDEFIISENAWRKGERLRLDHVRRHPQPRETR